MKRKEGEKTSIYQNIYINIYIKMYINGRTEK